MTVERIEIHPKKSDFKESLLVFIASGFGFGLSPVAPGTCGALSGVAAHILIETYFPPDLRWYSLVFAFIIVCLVHFLLTPWAVTYWLSKDPRHFVLDEVAGYLLVPILFRSGHLLQVVFWGFLLFRIFDIIKIPPARQIDRDMPGAWGILLDDIVSACYAVVPLFVMKWSGFF